MKIKKMTKNKKSKNFLKIKKSFKKRKKIKNKNNTKEKIIKTIFSLILLCIYILSPKHITKNFFYNIFNNKKRIGVSNLHNGQNVGNILVKFALFKKLKEYDFNVTMIIPGNVNNPDLSFINRTINSSLYILQKGFSELNENDFDYLIVNSEQTWRLGSGFDIGFLQFAKNWKIKKFVYAASIGTDNWQYRKRQDVKIKSLIKNFTGISFREIGTVKLAEEHLGVKGVLY